MTNMPATTPSEHQHTHAHAHAKAFIEAVRIDHGPHEHLGRFFLGADTLLRNRGLVASFAPVQQFADTNQRHFATWGRLIPLLDTRHARIPDRDALCIVCRDSRGEIVAIQGERLFRAGARTLADVVHSGEFFDSDLDDPTAEIGRCEITAPGAKTMGGHISYSGGLWVHPRYRSLRLASILPRLTRAYAVAHWGADYSVGFVKDDVAQTDLGRRYGYAHCEPAFQFYSRGALDYQGVLLWMTRSELLADLEQFLQHYASDIDARVDPRGAEHQRLRA